MRANRTARRNRSRTIHGKSRYRLSCETLERREMLTGTPVGDANYDNQFDADDVTLVLEAGKFETGEQATFRQGDWNGDGLFDSTDIVAALQEDYFDKGPIDPEPAPPKNVILVIGDGMGFEHVNAASMFLGEPLSFEAFPFQTQMVTANADTDPEVTDSAAAGTAIATGLKANNKVISQQLPGDGSDLTTILEVFKERGKSTGLVTTGSVTDATPAVFGAHEPNREDFAEIAADYFRDSRPNVLLGAEIQELAASAVEAGYTVVADVGTMNTVAAGEHSVDTHVFGGFANYNNLGFHDQLFDWDIMALEADESVAQLTGAPLPFADLGNPHLSEMTQAALDILGQNENGFFLMIESANIDKMCHAAGMNEYGLSNFLPAEVGGQFSGISVIDMETVELGNAVRTAVDWVESRELLGETLVVVTADHETAGLVVTADNGPGQHPDIGYTSDSLNYGGILFYDHTAANVPVYAIGRNAALFGADSEFGKEVLDNTEIYDRVLKSQSEIQNQEVPNETPPVE